MRVHAALLAGTMLGCGTQHWVKPHGGGTHTLVASLAAPMVGASSSHELVAPVVGAGYKYGLTRTSDVWGTWHGSAAALGSMYTELGMSLELLGGGGARPAIVMAAIQSQIFNAASSWSASELPIAIRWDLGPRTTVYVGSRQGLLLPLDESTDPWLWAPFVGGGWQLSKHWAFDAEARWLRPYAEPGLVRHLSPTGRGALSFAFTTQACF